jgi:acyl homoserine lactone synthase
LIVESSRFCVDTSRVTDLAGNGMRQATFLLFAAILEWSLDHGQRAIATVTDTRMERILRRAGWPLQRLGAPCMIGSTEAVAGLLAATDDTLRAIRASSGVSGRVLPGHEPMRLAA